MSDINKIDDQARQIIIDLIVEGWRFSKLFAKVLSTIFLENEGIVIALTEEMKEVFPTQRVIVYKKDGKIAIMECHDENLKDGQAISLKDEAKEN